MKRITLAMVIAISLVLWVTACGNGGGDGNSSTSVESDTSSATAITIKNFSFSPATITVTVGATVTWTNKDGVAHTVASDSGEWISEDLRDGESFSKTFTQTGQVSYHCSIHPSMKGKVIVTN